MAEQIQASGTANKTDRLAISHTIMHELWRVPMSYHVLSRIEQDLILNQAVVTFASFFNQQAYERGAQHLSFTAVTIPLAAADNSAVVNAVVSQKDGTFSGGEVVGA